MNATTFKLISFFIILLTGFLGGLLSRWIAASKKSECCFSLGNAFAGGVFLGAGVIHMLPDAQAGFSAIDGGADYPWFAVVCCAGFLLILFLEKVLIRCEQDEAATLMRRDLSLYPYVLMLVLSIHSVITGIALGTETRIIQAAVILIAVVAHKGTAAFSLGVSMFRGHIPTLKILGMLFLFSFMTPIGILMGLGCTARLSGPGEQLFEAVFDALAAGTFLYVALLDILQDEFSHHTHRTLKFALVLAGLTVMAVVAIWT